MATRLTIGRPPEREPRLFGLPQPLPDGLGKSVPRLGGPNTPLYRYGSMFACISCELYSWSETERDEDAKGVVQSRLARPMMQLLAFESGALMGVCLCCLRC